VQQAKALDEHLQRTGRRVGPLHGLAISLKVNFDIEGRDSTVSFTALVDKPAEYNATLVDMLEKLGAVRYRKTNVPSAHSKDSSIKVKAYKMQAEFVNNTFGRTTNPLNRKLTSGGSLNPLLSRLGAVRWA
jgi:amidase